ncbi:MAG: hypothetical protein JHC31_14995 [Sulfurihydrogenibium sp.]|jgi:hypothetical protein|nr:hypothetical protein [Sulfurihydrogenibium sp.]
MKVKKLSWSIYNEDNSDYYHIELEFSEPIYAEAYPLTSFRFGDDNYKRSGLIGKPWVKDLLAFRLEFHNKTYIIVVEEDFWSEYSDELTEFEFELEYVYPVRAIFRGDFKERSWITVMSEEEFDKYINELD